MARTIWARPLDALAVPQPGPAVEAVSAPAPGAVAVARRATVAAAARARPKPDQLREGVKAVVRRIPVGFGAVRDPSCGSARKVPGGRFQDRLRRRQIQGAHRRSRSGYQGGPGRGPDADRDELARL